jgi:hypothetical protein
MVAKEIDSGLPCCVSVCISKLLGLNPNPPIQVHFDWCRANKCDVQWVAPFRNPVPLAVG